ncbi:MAG: ORF6N domain-containing protein [Patescibacteria group bacterium]|jgi:hypothetical protein
MGKTAEKINSVGLIPVERIENKVLLIRGEKVMLDRDLADMYGVETRVLNQAVKRNKERFPRDFMFQLTLMEMEFLMREGIIIEDSLRSQIVTLNGKVGEDKTNLKSQIVTSSWGGRRKLPYVFTEQGVAMLSSVLKSKKAIEVNIAIMRAFVKIRKLVYSYKDLAEKIANIEQSHNKEIGRIWKVLNRLMSDEKPATGEIGFKAG